MTRREAVPVGGQYLYRIPRMGSTARLDLRPPGLRAASRSPPTAGEGVVEMLEFLVRNWVLVLVLGGMAFMHFGMHRGHGQSGHGGGCGGGRAHDGHEPDAHPLPSSDTAHRSQGPQADGAEIPAWGSPQDRPAPADTSVQAKDAPQGARRHRGC